MTLRHQAARTGCSHSPRFDIKVDNIDWFSGFDMMDSAMMAKKFADSFTRGRQVRKKVLPAELSNMPVAWNLSMMKFNCPKHRSPTQAWVPIGKKTHWDKKESSFPLSPWWLGGDCRERCSTSPRLRQWLTCSLPIHKSGWTYKQNFCSWRLWLAGGRWPLAAGPPVWSVAGGRWAGSAQWPVAVGRRRKKTIVPTSGVLRGRPSRLVRVFHALAPNVEAPLPPVFWGESQVFVEYLSFLQQKHGTQNHGWNLQITHLERKNDLSEPNLHDCVAVVNLQGV